jgi:hypothetical protein
MISHFGIRTRALISAGVLVAAMSGGIATAASADAATPHSLSCSSGLNNATTAWFTCTGSGTWQGYANCYFYPAQDTSWITQSGGTVHEWETCETYVTSTGFNY